MIALLSHRVTRRSLALVAFETVLIVAAVVARRVDAAGR